LFELTQKKPKAVPLGIKSVLGYKIIVPIHIEGVHSEAMLPCSAGSGFQHMLLRFGQRNHPSMTQVRPIHKTTRI